MPDMGVFVPLLSGIATPSHLGGGSGKSPISAGWSNEAAALNPHTFGALGC